MEETFELIMKVSKGNPGALSVIKQLEWYSRWYEMLKFLDKKGIVGGEIWAKYKDEFHQDASKFARWLEDEMARDKEFEHFYTGPKYIPIRPLKAKRKL